MGPCNHYRYLYAMPSIFTPFLNFFLDFILILLLGGTVEGSYLRTKIPSTGIIVASVAWPSKLATLILCTLALLGPALQSLVK